MRDTDQKTQLDHNYRLQRHIYDLTRKYYLLGRDQLIDDLALRPGQSVLEIGCGTARNLIRTHGIFPTGRLFGLDLSPLMLETARKNLAAAGLLQSVTLAEGDATAFDPTALFGQTRFDRVIFSFALSMIPAWQAALDQAVTCLAPAGRIEIVDFGTGEDLPRWANVALRQWLGRFHVTPRDELAGQLARLAHRHSLGLTTRQIYRSYTTVATLRDITEYRSPPPRVTPLAL